MLVREGVGFEEGGGEEVYLRPCGEAQEGFAYSSAISLGVRLLAFQRPESSFLEPQNGSGRS